VSGLKDNRIARTFRALAEQGEKALVTYIMGGDPDIPSTVNLVKALAEGGADLIELGVPFSDPMADGISIQMAGQRSLAAGTTLQSILDLVVVVRRDTQVPLILMSYYNPILQYGLERFAEQASRSGVDGLIVPDLPLEESGPLAEQLYAKGMYLIPLLAPTSTEARISQAAERENGFVYCVSVTGVTGARRELDHGVQDFLQRVRSKVEQPIAVGFGISTPEQAREMKDLADGVIVGSAIVNLVEKYGKDVSQAEVEIKQFVRRLKEGLSRSAFCS